VTFNEILTTILRTSNSESLPEFSSPESRFSRQTFPCFRTEGEPYELSYKYLVKGKMSRYGKLMILLDAVLNPTTLFHMHDMETVVLAVRC
jgi:hypothetical protein